MQVHWRVALQHLIQSPVFIYRIQQGGERLCVSNVTCPGMQCNDQSQGLNPLLSMLANAWRSKCLSLLWASQPLSPLYETLALSSVLSTSWNIRKEHQVWNITEPENYQTNLIVNTYLKTMGGVVALWLMCSSLDQAVRVWALDGDIVLCSWARPFTLTVRLSTQVYKWVPVNLMLG